MPTILTTNTPFLDLFSYEQWDELYSCLSLNLNQEGERLDPALGCFAPFVYLKSEAIDADSKPESLKSLQTLLNPFFHYVHDLLHLPPRLFSDERLTQQPPSSDPNFFKSLLSLEVKVLTIYQEFYHVFTNLTSLSSEPHRLRSLIPSIYHNLEFAVIVLSTTCRLFPFTNFSVENFIRTLAYIDRCLALDNLFCCALFLNRSNLIDQSFEIFAKDSIYFSSLFFTLSLSESSHIDYYEYVALHPGLPQLTSVLSFSLSSPVLFSTRLANFTTVLFKYPQTCQEILSSMNSVLSLYPLLGDTLKNLRQNLLQTFNKSATRDLTLIKTLIRSISLGFIKPLPSVLDFSNFFSQIFALPITLITIVIEDVVMLFLSLLGVIPPSQTVLISDLFNNCLVNNLVSFFSQTKHLPIIVSALFPIISFITKSLTTHANDRADRGRDVLNKMVEHYLSIKVPDFLKYSLEIFKTHHSLPYFLWSIDPSSFLVDSSTINSIKCRDLSLWIESANHCVAAGLIKNFDSISARNFGSGSAWFEQLATLVITVKFDTDDVIIFDCHLLAEVAYKVGYASRLYGHATINHHVFFKLIELCGVNYQRDCFDADEILPSNISLVLLQTAVIVFCYFYGYFWGEHGDVEDETLCSISCFLSRFPILHLYSLLNSLDQSDLSLVLLNALKEFKFSLTKTVVDFDDAELFCRSNQSILIDNLDCNNEIVFPQFLGLSSNALVVSNDFIILLVLYYKNHRNLLSRSQHESFFKFMKIQLENLNFQRCRDLVLDLMDVKVDHNSLTSVEGFLSNIKLHPAQLSIPGFFDFFNCFLLSILPDSKVLKAVSHETIKLFKTFTGFLHQCCRHFKVTSLYHITDPISCTSLSSISYFLSHCIARESRCIREFLCSPVPPSVVFWLIERVPELSTGVSLIKDGLFDSKFCTVENSFDFKRGLVLIAFVFYKQKIDLQTSSLLLIIFDYLNFLVGNPTSSEFKSVSSSAERFSGSKLREFVIVFLDSLKVVFNFSNEILIKTRSILDSLSSLFSADVFVSELIVSVRSRLEGKSNDIIDYANELF
ncbi:hypothetical protein RCL1_001722 [Eukaryota sp. TZLM3-RCL]